MCYRRNAVKTSAVISNIECAILRIGGRARVHARNRYKTFVSRALLAMSIDYAARIA